MKCLKKIIEYGLYLLVFILPIQARWIIKPGELNGGYWEYGTVSLYLTDILLIFILIIFIILETLKSKLPITNYQLPNKIPNSKFQIPNFWRFIALIEVAIFISIFFAADKSLAVYSYIRFLLGVGLFWLIISTKYDKIKLLWSLIAGAVIQAGLGIWQFLTQSSFAFKWLGIAEHKPFDLGTSVVEALGVDGIWERWLRAYGGLDHPNVLGGLLVIISLFLIILLDKKLNEPRNSNKIFNFQFSIFKQFLNFQILKTLILFTVYCLLLTSLFFTFSRGAWAGFVAGLIVMLAILLWQKDKQAMKKALELVFTGAVIILFLFNLYSNLVLTRLSKDTRLEIKSNTERLESYKYAKEIIKKNWLFGVGMENYTLVLRNEIDSKQPSYFYQPVHNTFLLIWAETGILGLAGFLGLLGYLIINYQLSIIKQFSKTKIIENCKLKIENLEREYLNKNINRNNILLLPILLAIIVMMLVDHWYWSLHFGVLFFWVVIGIIMREEKFKQ